MRRSVPDTRKYQVVLAVDNSKSMTEMGCQQDALRALNLISKSLTRLEVRRRHTAAGLDAVLPSTPSTLCICTNKSPFWHTCRSGSWESSSLVAQAVLRSCIHWTGPSTIPRDRKCLVRCDAISY